MKSQVEFYESVTTGRWVWILRKSNGQEQAKSSKDYSTRQICRQAWLNTVSTVSGGVDERSFPA